MAVKDPGARSTPGKGITFTIDPKRGLWYRFVKVVVIGASKLLFHPEIIQDEPIPATGAVLIAPVHRSNLDFIFAVYLTDRKVFYMAKDSLWKSRLLGALLVSLGAFPVHRESADRESLQRAEQVLAMGEVLVMFPEGTRQSGDGVAELHEGATYLASKTGARLVPMGIAGTDVAMAKGAKLPKPTKVVVVTGSSIAPADKGESGRISRSKVKASTAELAEGIQAVYDRSRERLSARAAGS